MLNSVSFVKKTLIESVSFNQGTHERPTWAQKVKPNMADFEAILGR